MTEVAVSADLLVTGSAEGVALVLDEPLSLWGGLNPIDGRITDVHHLQHNECVTGTVLILPHGRGSSSASSVLAEAIRLGTAPVALVLAEPDEILALGSLVGEELYAVATPIAVLAPSAHQQLRTGQRLRIEDGAVIQLG